MEAKHSPQHGRDIVRNAWNLPLWPWISLYNTCGGTLGCAVGLQTGDELSLARQDINLATTQRENALDHSDWPAAMNEFRMC